MPLTPLYMGPELLARACLQGALVLTVFGWSQILIDLQSLTTMLTGRGELHGFSHTCAGAIAIALVAAPSGKFPGDFGLRLPGLGANQPIGWRVAVASAPIGTWATCSSMASCAPTCDRWRH